jgi:hypothetical protein
MAEKEPYGAVEYADPGHQSDGVKRYPIDTEEHIRAAWNYIHHPDNAAKYSPEHAASVKAKIVAAWKEKIDPAGPPEASAEKIECGLYMKIVSGDARSHEVEGIATNETPDKTNEIMDYMSSKPLIKAWSDEQFEKSDGKSYGNVREMHDTRTRAVGKLTHIDFDDSNKLVKVRAKIVDDEAWNKIEEGLYTGFSFGGKYAKRWPNGDGMTRYTLRPFELTLADNACVPGTNFRLVKTDGSTVDVPLKGVELLQLHDGDAFEVDGKRFKIELQKSAPKREEAMTPEETKRLDDLEKNLTDLKKFTEGQTAHLKAVAVHHAAMGEHLSSLCDEKGMGKTAKDVVADFLGKTAAGEKSIGKTAEGAEILQKSDGTIRIVPVDPTAAVLSKVTEQLDNMQKMFTGFVQGLHDNLKDRPLPGVVRPIVAATVSKTADGTDKKEPVVDPNKDRHYSSSREAAADGVLLKSVLSDRLGTNEIEMIETRKNKSVAA